MTQPPQLKIINKDTLHSTLDGIMANGKRSIVINSSIYPISLEKFTYKWDFTKINHKFTRTAKIDTMIDVMHKVSEQNSLDIEPVVEYSLRLSYEATTNRDIRASLLSTDNILMYSSTTEIKSLKWADYFFQSAMVANFEGLISVTKENPINLVLIEPLVRLPLFDNKYLVEGRPNGIEVTLLTSGEASL